MRTKILLLTILGTIFALFAAGALHAQDNTAGPLQPDLLGPIAPDIALVGPSNVLKTAGANAGRVAQDGFNFYKSVSFKRGFDVAVVGLRHDGMYGGGIVVSPVNTNAESQVGVGFGLFALQERDSVTLKKKLSFYDAAFTFTYQRTEVIPIVEIPINVVLGTGPAVKLNGGTGVLMEQSDALFEYTYEFGRHNYLTLGGGVVHCSGLSGSGVADALYLRYEHWF